VNILHILLVAASLFFTALPAQADLERPRLNLVYQRTETCRSFAVTVFAISRHAKGDRGGRLNERNSGIGGLCYLDKGQYFHIIHGGLENSQSQPAFVFGPGVRLFTPRVHGLAVGAGLELPFLHYTLRDGRGAAYGFLPITSLTVNYQIPMTNKFGL
jgi:hypothetical protein